MALSIDVEFFDLDTHVKECGVTDSDSENGPLGLSSLSKENRNIPRGWEKELQELPERYLGNLIKEKAGDRIDKGDLKKDPGMSIKDLKKLIVRVQKHDVWVQQAESIKNSFDWYRDQLNSLLRDSIWLDFAKVSDDANYKRRLQEIRIRCQALGDLAYLPPALMLLTGKKLCDMQGSCLDMISEVVDKVLHFSSDYKILHECFVQFSKKQSCVLTSMRALLKDYPKLKNFLGDFMDILSKIPEDELSPHERFFTRYLRYLLRLNVSLHKLRLKLNGSMLSQISDLIQEAVLPDEGPIVRCVQDLIEIGAINKGLRMPSVSLHGFDPKYFGQFLENIQLLGDPDLNEEIERLQDTLRADEKKYYTDLYNFVFNEKTSISKERAKFSLLLLRNMLTEDDYLLAEETIFGKFLEKYQGNDHDMTPLFLMALNTNWKILYFSRRFEYLFKTNIIKFLEEWELYKDTLKIPDLQKNISRHAQKFIEDRKSRLGNLEKEDLNHVRQMIKICLLPEERALIENELGLIAFEIINKCLNKYQHQKLTVIKCINQVKKIQDNFPLGEVVKYKFEAFIKDAHNQPWALGYHLLLEAFGTDDQKARYQMHWLRNFLNPKGSMKQLASSYPLHTEKETANLRTVYKTYLSEALVLLMSILVIIQYWIKT